MNDTDTLPQTTAQRHLADHEAELLKAIETRESILRTAAAAMTKATLREELESDGRTTYGFSAPSKSAPVGDYITVYVKRRSQASPEQKAFMEAREAARNDTMLDDAMLGLVATRNEQITKLLTAGEKGVTPGAQARMIASHLEWNADTIQTAVDAADLADTYLSARLNGKDPVEIAKHLAAKAIEHLKETVHSTGNLRLDSHGLSRIAKAQAHRAILGMVVRVLPQDIQDVVGWY